MVFFSRPIKLDFYVIWICLCVIGYLLASFLYPREMFYPIAQDGFSFGVAYMESHFFEWRIQWLVHFLRYLSVYPFWYFYQNDYSSFMQSLVLLVYMLPLLILEIENKVWRYLRFFVLLLPFLISFRSCLSVVSVTLIFLFMYSSVSSNPIFLFSGLLSNLSSGVVLPWLILVFLNRARLRVNKIILFISFAILTASLSCSLVQKFSYFNDVGPGPGPNVIADVSDNLVINCGDSVFCTVLKRNTIFVSYKKEQYLRLGAYLLLFSMIFLSYVVCFLNRMPEQLFFLVALPGFMFEGLWVVSFSLSVVVFLVSFFIGLINDRRSIFIQ